MEKNNEPIDNYSIELYVGEKRSGKTLSMIAQTYEDIKNNNYPIYSNVKLNRKYFPNFQYITAKDLEDFYMNQQTFKHAIFLMDEIHILMDSRKFGKNRNQAIGYFLGQMGKRSNIFRGTTHFPHLIDFRLRCYCEKWNYIRKGLVVNNKWMPILNNNKKLTNEENKRLYIQIKPIIRKLIDFEFYDVNMKTVYINASDYFDMYDTEELIIPT